MASRNPPTSSRIRKKKLPPVLAMTSFLASPPMNLNRAMPMLCTRNSSRMKVKNLSRQKDVLDPAVHYQKTTTKLVLCRLQN